MNALNPSNPSLPDFRTRKSRLHTTKVTPMVVVLAVTVARWVPVRLWRFLAGFMGVSQEDLARTCQIIDSIPAQAGLPCLDATQRAGLPAARDPHLLDSVQAHAVALELSSEVQKASKRELDELLVPAARYDELRRLRDGAHKIQRRVANTSAALGLLEIAMHNHVQRWKNRKLRKLTPAEQIELEAEFAEIADLDPSAGPAHGVADSAKDDGVDARRLH